jgi:hypothetical protein
MTKESYRNKKVNTTTMVGAVKAVKLFLYIHLKRECSPGISVQHGVGLIQLI